MSMAKKRKPLVLDLFSGLWGWSEGFLAEGWEVIGIDLKMPPYIPDGARFAQFDILQLTPKHIRSLNPDFIVCSSPCEQFSVHCMKHFHPNPKHPEMGIRLFEHSRMLCESARVSYVMENVRCAEKFVGKCVNHCGPFYLWGTGVPAIIPLKCYFEKKGQAQGNSETCKRLKREGKVGELREYRSQFYFSQSSSGSEARKLVSSQFATIPESLSRYLAQTVTTSHPLNQTHPRSDAATNAQLNRAVSVFHKSPESHS